MAFGTISTNSKTFNSIGAGVYQLSTVLFGGPVNLFKVTGGKRTNAKAPTSASVSRHLEKDITIGDKIERRKASVVLQITVPAGFTPAEVAELNADMVGWMTDAILTRLLMGES